MRTRVRSEALLGPAIFVLVSLALVDVGAAPLARALPTGVGPTTPLLDDFNRPNETPVAQFGKWSAAGIDGAAGPRLLNTQLHALGGATDGSAYRVEPQTGDMEVHATIASGPANLNGLVIYINLQDVGTTGWDGYGLRLYKQIGGHIWNLYKYTNGTATNLGGWSGGPAQGDRMLLRRVGGQVQAWYYTATNQTWTLKVTATDSTYLNGHIGVRIIDNGYGGVPVFDDFGGTETVEPEEPPAFPATPVLDHFNRVPEDPLSQSGNWAPTDPSGNAAGTLEVNKVLGRNLDSGGTLRSYRTTDYEGYTEVYFTVGVMPGSGDWLELLLNLQDVGSSSWDGYRLYVTDGSSDQFFIARVDNGVSTPIAGPVVWNVFAGERLLGRRIGSMIEFWHQLGTGAWSKIVAVQDATYTGGKIGAGVRDKNGGIEDFGGGNIVSNEPLLQLFAPQMRFWNEEVYRADSAAIATDLYLEEPEDHSVTLKCCWETELATVASADPNSSLPDLSLDYLSQTQPTPDYYLAQPKIYPDDILGAAIDYLAWVDTHPEHRGITYGRVYDPAGPGDKILQYWMFYYYNPKDPWGFGNHEGDWEWVQVRLTEANVPVSVAISQHGNGDRCAWGPAIQIVQPSTPVVYVAYESHANYFWPGAHPAPGDPDLAGDFGPTYYEFPRVVDVTSAPGWMTWDGHWGASFGSFLGPTPSPESPGAQEEPWDDPIWWEDNNTDGCTGPPSLRRASADGTDSEHGSSLQIDAGSKPNGADRLRTTHRGKPALPRILDVKTVERSANGRAVRVSYCFGSLGSNPWKRPWKLHLSIENVRDDLPPLSGSSRVTMRCGKVIHPVGPIKPPYLLRYSVESRRGSRSGVAVLRLTPGKR